jgi:hypothetical protein
MNGMVIIVLRAGAPRAQSNNEVNAGDGGCVPRLAFLVKVVERFLEIAFGDDRKHAIYFCKEGYWECEWWEVMDEIAQIKSYQ